MSTQLSFEVQGMFCARCAGEIERVLLCCEGVIAASVNYASGHATVVYESSRVTLGELVNRVRGTGFEVPLNVSSVPISDLAYATHPRTVERVLSRTQGVVQVAADLATGRVTLTALSAEITREAVTGLFAFGLYVGLAGVHSAKRLLVRTLVLAAAESTLAGMALFQLNSGPAEALRGLLAVGVLAALGILVVGYPLFHHTAATLLVREFDSGVLVGLLAFASLVVGLELITLTHPLVWDWGAWAAFTFASVLTTGWFLVRLGAVWGWSEWGNPRSLKRLAPPAPAHPLEVLSNGSRH